MQNASQDYNPVIYTRKLHIFPVSDTLRYLLLNGVDVYILPGCDLYRFFPRSEFAQSMFLNDEVN